MPPTSPSNPEWTKHDSAELASAMAQVLMTHRREIYDWPTLTHRWKSHGYDTLLRKLKAAIRDDLVKKHEGAEMLDGPQRGGGASGGSPLGKTAKRIMGQEERGVGKRERALVVRKSSSKKGEKDDLFSGSSDGDADSESEEGTPSPRTNKKSTRHQMATTTTPTTPRPKARPSVACAPASTSRRAIRDGSPEVITIDDSSDEDIGQSRSNAPSSSSRPLMLLDRRHRHRGHSHDDDDDVETTSGGDGGGDSPGPLLLTPSQGDSSSPTMDQWRSRVLYSGDSSSQSPSQSRQTPTKKRPASSSSARAGGSSGGGASSSMQPPSSRLKRLKMPASGFDRRDYETSPTAHRQQRGAAVQAATKLHETRWAFPTEESDWEEEQEEREREIRDVAAAEDGETRQEEDEELVEEQELEQQEEDELEDRSLVKSASRRSEMLASLFPSDHDDEEFDV